MTYSTLLTMYTHTPPPQVPCLTSPLFSIPLAKDKHQFPNSTPYSTLVVDAYSAYITSLCPCFLIDIIFGIATSCNPTRDPSNRLVPSPPDIGSTSPHVLLQSSSLPTPKRYAGITTWTASKYPSTTTSYHRRTARTLRRSMRQTHGQMESSIRNRFSPSSLEPHQLRQLSTSSRCVRVL
jgi:hypothetical protein